jgi:hypothetical protein
VVTSPPLIASFDSPGLHAIPRAAQTGRNPAHFPKSLDLQSEQSAWPLSAGPGGRNDQGVPGRLKTDRVLLRTRSVVGQRGVREKPADLDWFRPGGKAFHKATKEELTAHGVEGVGSRTTDW